MQLICIVYIRYVTHYTFFCFSVTHFSDFCNCSPIALLLNVLCYLNELFSIFCKNTNSFLIFKIKTIGSQKMFTLLQFIQNPTSPISLKKPKMKHSKLWERMHLLVTCFAVLFPSSSAIFCHRRDSTSSGGYFKSNCSSFF